MAIYDYICPNGHKQEVWLKMSEERPESVKCYKMSCDQPAIYKLSVPNTFIWDCEDFH